MASQLLRRMRALFVRETLTEQETETMLQGLQNLNTNVAALIAEVAAAKSAIVDLRAQVAALQIANGDDDAAVQAAADQVAAATADLAAVAPLPVAADAASS